MSDGEQDYERIYRDFWQDIIEKDGQVTMDQVKRELYDFWVLMDNAGKVYYHVTGGKLSKTNYDAQVICDEADENYRKLYEEIDA